MLRPINIHVFLMFTSSSGASFDRDLWHDIGAIIGTEARGLNNQAIADDGGADGVDAGRGKRVSRVPGLPPGGKAGLYFLDPNINLMRDPRWGRAQE